MIVNAGQTDGAYTQMALKTVQSADPTTGAGGGGGAGGAGGSSTGNGGNGATPDADSGCGCSVPGAEGGPSAALVIAAAGIAASMVRRRKSRLS
jgi:MYXO-CTERM domain-containing protein